MPGSSESSASEGRDEFGFDLAAGEDEELELDEDDEDFDDDELDDDEDEDGLLDEDELIDLDDESTTMPTRTTSSIRGIGYDDFHLFR